MASIILRVPLGTIPLTNAQADSNFQNLNNALGANGSTTIPTPSGTGVPLLSISPTTTGTFTAANITFAGSLVGGTGSFTTLSTSGQLTSTVASGTAPFVVTSTNNVANLNASSLNGATFAAPGAIGSGTASTGAFTTLSASTSATITSLTVNTTVSGTGFSTYLASPPAIGGTAAAAVTGSNLMSSGGLWAKAAYTGTAYTSGVLIDYTTNLGRISVGTSDGLAFYYGNTGTETLRIDTTGNLILKTGSLQEVKTSLAANDINISLGNYFTKSITTTTTLTVSNVPTTGTVASFILDLTNGGAFTVTWWANMKWAAGNTPTLTASGRDILGFFTHDAGTTWNGLVLAKDIK